MLEDSDVVFEGHELDRYLQEIGFSDYEVVSTKDTSGSKGIKQNLQQMVNAIRNGLQMILPGCEAEKKKVYASLQLETEIILNSGLLLEADFHCISCLLEPISATKGKPPWSLSLYGIGTCVLMMAWKKKLVPLILPAMYTCVMSVHVLNSWYFHRQRKKISEVVVALLHVLKEMSSQTRRVILYIQENELLLKGYTLARSRTAVLDDLKTLKTNWYLMIGLRERIAQVMHSIIDVLKFATKFLVTQFPLKGQLDNEHNYAAFMISEDLEIAAPEDDINMYSLKYLKSLQNANILLQSEFLRRYALCCIPSLWKDEFQNLTPLLKTASIVSHRLNSFIDSVILDYKFYSCYGKGESSISQRPVSAIYNVSNAFIGVHSARLNMQGVLHKVMQLEEILEQNERDGKLKSDFLDSVCRELNEVAQEMESCSNCIDIAISYCKASEDKVQLAVTTTAPPLGTGNAVVEKTDPIPVGFSDFDPDVEDEVFEALIHNSMSIDDDDVDYYDNVLEKEDKLQKECSKRMMSELKTVLVHKAEEMKKREDQALRNKGILVTDESPVEDNITHIDTSDPSKTDSLNSKLIDSLTSEVVDFEAPIGVRNSDVCQSGSGWSLAGLPVKPLAKTLVGEEETFGDSAESDSDEL